MFLDIWRTLLISAEDGLLRHRSQAALGPPQTTAKSVLLAWMEWLLKLQTWLVKQWYIYIYLYIWSAARPWSIYMIYIYTVCIYIYILYAYIYIYIYIYICWLSRRAAVEHLLTYACINLISQCQPRATSITVYNIYNPPSGWGLIAENYIWSAKVPISYQVLHSADDSWCQYGRCWASVPLGIRCGLKRLDVGYFSVGWSTACTKPGLVDICWFCVYFMVFSQPVPWTSLGFNIQLACWDSERRGGKTPRPGWVLLGHEHGVAGALCLSCRGGLRWNS